MHSVPEYEKCRKFIYFDKKYVIAIQFGVNEVFGHDEKMFKKFLDRNGSNIGFLFNKYKRAIDKWIFPLNYTGILFLDSE